MFDSGIDGEDPTGNLVPFIAGEFDGLIWRTDVGDDDNGAEYTARIVSRPMAPGNLQHEFRVHSGTLLAKAASGAVIDVKIHRNFGLDTKTVSSVSLAPTGTEGRVIKYLDNLSLAMLKTVQFEVVDPATPGERWQIEMLALYESPGQRAK
jgi:hypothetical protein